MTFETLALGRADDASELSPLPPTAPRVESDGHVSWVRADHVEHLRNGADGVEQSWSFSQRPAGRGDLIVRVAAEGLPVAGHTEGGLHFADATGLGLRYGHATWVSGDGARTRVPVAWRAGAVELRVPSGVLDTSTYPAVLDPTVGPEFGMDEPVWVGAPSGAYLPRVASNGAGYLVAWVDSRAWGFRIYGARVSLNGILQDDAGLALTPYETWASAPAIASDGTDYLVVWEEGMIAPETRILGTRVTHAGVVLDPDSIVISDAAEHQGAPSVASNGAGYLVVWQDERNGSDQDIFGARVTVGGVVEDPFGFVIATAPRWQGAPAVASNGDDYLVAWADHRANDGDVYAARVSSLGVVLDTSSFAISTAASSPDGVSVASDGTDYYVAWTDRRAGSSWEVYGTPVTSNGVVQDPAGLLVSHASVVPGATSVTSDGTHYFVAWSQESGGTGGTYGARVSSAGTLLDSPGVLISAAASQAASVAFDGSNYLVAWEGPDAGADISTTRVTTDGVVLDPAGVLVRTDANGQRGPAVAFNGSDYLVVWYDGRGGRELADVYGVRVSSAGVVRDPLGIRIGAAGLLRYSRPAVASNGSSFLVGWLAAGQFDSSLWTSLVSSGGTVAAPTHVAGGGRIGLPSLASNGSDYLAVWGERTSPNLRRNYAARIAADGTLLEPSRIELGVWWVDRGSPVAASNGTDYLVVWTEGQAPTWSLHGTGLGPSGLPRDPEGLLIAADLYVTGQPSIASNGEDYLVTWAQAEGAARGVYGTRVMSTGAPRDPTPFLIGEMDAYCGGNSIAVAFSGVDYVVLWCAAGEGSDEIRAAEVGRDGSVASRAVVATIPGPYSFGTSLAVSAGSPGQALVAYSRQADFVARVFGRLLSTLDADGSACSEGAACETGHCVDGVCCNSACGGGESTDCQACVASLTGLADGVCGWVPADTPCGDGTVADCDAADTCDAAGACQPNLATAGCGTDGGIMPDANVTLDSGPAPDSGDDADVTSDSALSPDASLLPDAGHGAVSGGACGCRVAALRGEGPVGAGHALLFVGMLLVAVRRRRTRRALREFARGGGAHPVRGPRVTASTSTSAPLPCAAPS
ncbi:MAG: hypothetical protein KC668_19310 [Myxococcales bacterium]|nr:hypothetical protein [Myxococcales bacterium]